MKISLSRCSYQAKRAVFTIILLVSGGLKALSCGAVTFELPDTLLSLSCTASLGSLPKSLERLSCRHLEQTLEARSLESSLLVAKELPSSLRCLSVEDVQHLARLPEVESLSVGWTSGRCEPWT